MGKQEGSLQNKGSDKCIKPNYDDKLLRPDVTNT